MQNTKRIFILTLSIAYAVFSCVFSCICVYTDAVKTAVLLTGAVVFILSLAIGGLFFVREGWIAALVERLDALPDAKYQAHIFLFVSVAWLPAYLALFPGIFGYDSPIQVYYFLREGLVMEQHPALHTLVLSFFIYLGGLLGNYTLGFAMFTTVQALTVVYAISDMQRLQRKMRVPFPFRSAMLLITVLNPAVQVLTFNSTKDILFSACFLEFAVNLCFVLMAEQTNRRDRVRLIVWGCLSALLRNQMIYVIAVMLIATLFLYRVRQVLRTYCVIIAVFILSTVILHALPTLAFDNFRETLSVPVQQLGAVGYNCLSGEGEEVISRRELETLEEIISEKALLSYTGNTADPVKNAFRTDKFFEDPKVYTTLYLNIGLHNARTYLRAWLDLITPYWNFDLAGYEGLSLMYCFPERNVWSIELHNGFPAYYDYLSHIGIYGLYRRIPASAYFGIRGSAAGR